MPEQLCNLSAKIKSKFPISISQNLPARRDELEFTGLCQELVLAKKPVEHTGLAVKTLNVSPDRFFCARSAHPEKSLSLYSLEAPCLNAI